MAENPPSSSFDYNPMANPGTGTWEVPMSSTDRSKLTKGFSPEDMDDKWVLHAEAPDAEGHFVLRMCRSWTGDEQIALTVQQTKITQIQWEKRDDFGEEDAKDLAKGLCKRFLDCDLEVSS